MPGILIGVKPARPQAGAEMQRRLRRAVHSHEQVRSEDFGDTWAVSTAGRASHALSRATSADGTIVWGFGRVFPRTDDSLSLQRLYAQPLADVALLLLRDDGWRFLERLNGEFNLAVWEPTKGRLTVTGDRYGLRPWYVRQSSGSVWLAPTIRQVLMADESPVRLDDEGLNGYLAYSRLRLGQRTLIEGVSVLPPAALWQINCHTGEVTQSAYWRIHFNDSMADGEASDDQIDELCESFRAAVRRRVNGGNTMRFGVSLSGGLDSRAVVAALPEEAIPNVWTSTCGLPDSDEVKLAAKVAEVAGLRHEIFPLAAGDYVEAADRMFQFSDGVDLFVQSAQDSWLESASAKADVFLTGLAMDMTLGGTYLTSEVLAARDLTDLRPVVESKHSGFRPLDLEAVVHPSRRSAVTGGAWDMLLATMRQTGQDSVAGAHEHLSHSARVHGVIMMRHASIRHYMATMAVTYDCDFLDQVLALPLTWRMEHRTYAKFMCRLSPALAALPYQRTLVPPTVPVEFWKVAAEIERQREQLYLDIWKATDGRVALPYRRYYTNFDEWLRTDPRWHELINATLLAPTSMIYELGILQPEAVAALVARNRAGEGGCRTGVIVMTSLELYLRQVFGRTS